MDYWDHRERRRAISRRRLLASTAIGGVGISALTLVGCGDDDDDSGASGTPGSGTQQPTTQQRPKTPAEVTDGMNLRNATTGIKMGGTFRTTGALAGESIDPRKNGAKGPQDWFGKTTSQLVASDAAPGIGPYEEPVVADIAERWEQPDATTFVFKLNPKAKWQNRPPANGRAVKASDVKYSFDLWAGSGISKTNFEPMDKIEALDDSTVKITMKRPTPEALDVFAFEHHGIVNPEYMDSKGGDLGTGDPSFVGSGPFMVIENEINVKTTYVRNPDYWQTDKAGNRLPYVDRLEFVSITDPAAMQAAYRTGQIMSVMVPVDQFKNYADDQNSYLAKYVVAAGMGKLGFQNRTAPLNDPRVRQAFSMAINRKAINDNFYGGAAEPVAVIPPRAFGKKDLMKWGELPPKWQHNPAEAKKLLAAAGYPNGLEIPFTHYFAAGSAAADVQLLIQQSVKEVGITINPKFLDRTAFFSVLYPGQFQGVMSWVSSLPGVASQAWAEWMHSKANNNWYGINDPQVDLTVEKLRVTLDNNERAKLFDQLQKLEWENIYRGWLTTGPFISAFKSNVRNPMFLANGFLSYKYHTAKYVWVAS